jgi:hypothetical protein
VSNIPDVIQKKYVTVFANRSTKERVDDFQSSIINLFVLFVAEFFDGIYRFSRRSLRLLSGLCSHFGGVGWRSRHIQDIFEIFFE